MFLGSFAVISVRTTILVPSSNSGSAADPLTLVRGMLLQVVTALGPIFGKLPEGGFGYFDGMTSEKVDSQVRGHPRGSYDDWIPPVKGTIVVLPKKSVGI